MIASVSSKTCTMGQPGIPYASNTPEKNDTLANIAAHISRLDTKIAALAKEKSDLEHARAYILSFTISHESRSSSHNRVFSAHYSAFLQMHSTASTIRNPSSSLRHQAILQHTRRHERSSTSPPSSGPLSSETFEAAYTPKCIDAGINNGNNPVEAVSLVPSVEVPPALPTHKSTSLVESFISSTSDTSVDSNGGNGQGTHWARKKNAKRKLQDNAVKARAARWREMSDY